MLAPPLAALVGAVVEGLQDGEGGDGDHDDEGDYPHGDDAFVGVRQGLPAP